jgi:hypothetical protein
MNKKGRKGLIRLVGRGSPMPTQIGLWINRIVISHQFSEEIVNEGRKPRRTNARIRGVIRRLLRFKITLGFVFGLIFRGFNRA